MICRKKRFLSLCLQENKKTKCTISQIMYKLVHIILQPEYHTNIGPNHPVTLTEHKFLIAQK